MTIGDHNEICARDMAAAKERRVYLLDVYKLYQVHINAMFNYFIILAGLIANGYIQSMQRQAEISKALSGAVAMFGALMSLIALLIHIRSRGMLESIESSLIAEEDKIFEPTRGFLNAQRIPRAWFLRHKFQFPLAYSAFIVGFLVMAIYSFHIYVGQIFHSVCNTLK